MADHLDARMLVPLRALWLVSLLVGCDPRGDPIVSHPLAPRRPEEKGETLFERLSADQTGVNFACPMDMQHRLSLLNHTAFVCGGVSIGDVSGDGRPDLFLASGPDRNRLYLQTGDFEFEDVTSETGVGGGEAWGVGAAMADIEGDGDLDIYVCNYDAPNQLFMNSGRGQGFIESARGYGLDLTDASLMPAFADYDNDGDLDVFVLTYRYYRPGGRPRKPPFAMKDGKPFILPEYVKYYSLRQIGSRRYTADTCGRPDRLFRNNGDGTFTDVSLKAGITERGHGLSATWWDYNRDGLIDLYVGNDFTDPDHLYRNNGSGTFTDVISSVMPSMTWSSMGADCADINGDGLLDFMSTEMLPTTHYKEKIVTGEIGGRGWFLEHGWPRQIMRNHVFLNTGMDRFMEVAFLCGLANTDWTWATKMGDFDNDGRVDVFVANGCARMSNDADHPVTTQMLVGQTEWDIWKDQPPLKEQNLAFRNEGDLNFRDVSKEWGLDHVGMSYSAAYGDLDGDGDLDLVVNNLGEPLGVYRNGETQGHRVIVELKGTTSNRRGLGAAVRIETGDGGRQVRPVNPMTGYASCNEPVVHFGLGQADVIRRLTVTWPSGHVQSFEGLAADRRYTITEPEGEAIPKRSSEGRRSLQFAEVTRASGLSFVHREIPYDDYARQPLLPAKLSQLGGGLAWGDADGDADEDLFVAGASGQSGKLYLNGGSGRFEDSIASRDVFEADKICEDMAPLWFDADSDGDLDLLVTSGSVEGEADDRRLVDRLYLNDGKAHFARAPDAVLPPAKISSGVAVAGDVDSDGDLDLFIGGRAVPGRYPETPRSRLLRNDRGRFIDITESFAPGLSNVGLVTGALWSDANQDGRVDLWITLEWGPVKLFANSGDRLEDRTKVAGLDQRVGWWNSITGADIDRDGDIDYIVMNAGLNTKYGKGTDAAPIWLFYGDMEESGRKRIVEARGTPGGWLPIRSRPCVQRAMPMIEKRCPTHRSFAASSLSHVFPPRRLDEAIQLRADCFASGTLINNGERRGGRLRFGWRPLPRLAQASPGYGVVATDLDGDGRVDIHAVQNFLHREPKTGPWNGGIGVTLRAEAKGSLELVPPTRTGLVIAGDARGLTVCDLNQDGWPDLVATQNNDRLLAFQNAAGKGTRPITVTLRGRPGNPTGVGSRIRAAHADGQTQTAEIYAGSGYLSQSTGTLFFGQGSSPIRSIHTYWSGGQETVTEVAKGTSHIVIDHPDR